MVMKIFSYFILFVFFLIFGHTMCYVGSQCTNQGSNPRPLKWKCNILTTGLQGKSFSYVIFIFVFPFTSLKSEIYLEIIFSVRHEEEVIFSPHIAIQLTQHFIKQTIFLPFLGSANFCIDKMSISNVDFFLGYLICCIGLFVYSSVTLSVLPL